MAAYARARGPGVKWHANVIWNDSQSAKSETAQYDAAGVLQTTAVADGTSYMGQIGQSENSGTALVTGIKVTF